MILLLLTIPVFSQALKFDSYENEDGMLFYVKNSEPFLTSQYSKGIEQPGKIFIDKNGFKHILFENEEIDILLIDGYQNSLYECGSLSNPPKIRFTKPMGIDNDRVFLGDFSPIGKYNTKVTASSYLKDKNHEYKPQNVNFTMYTGDCSMWGFVETIVPWVEGKDGYGIGEWIAYDISSLLENYNGLLDNKNAKLYILNGYVNPKLPHLYKENSRIKKATLIIDDSTKMEIDFNDIVEFKCVELDRPFSKIKIVINEVYKGTKYDDTCITAISVDWDDVDWDRN